MLTSINRRPFQEFSPSPGILQRPSQAVSIVDIFQQSLCNEMDVTYGKMLDVQMTPRSHNSVSN